MFKKLIVLSVLGTLFISTFQPRKAEAGVILFAAGLGTSIGGASRANNSVTTGVGVSLVAIGAAVGMTGIFTIMPGGLPFGTALTLIILDADGNQKIDALTNFFANRYSFVDNMESLGNLSQLVINHAVAKTPDAEGHILVSLDESEVTQALQSADLTESQLKMIAADLK